VEGVEGDFFRKIAGQGHNGHLSMEHTRQGIYAFTPAGELLASTVSPFTPDVTRMLETALAKWSAKTGEAPDPSPMQGTPPRYIRPEAQLPEDGTALQIFSRDLPRPRIGAAPARAPAWNMDSVWLTSEDVRSFFPGPRAAGPVAARVALRLGCYHLIDTVPGLAPAFDPGEVRRAVLSSRTEKARPGTVRVTVTGEFHAVRPGPPEFGFCGTLLGRAGGTPGHGKLDLFEAVVIGMRWGPSAFGLRGEDITPNPIGYALTLSRDPAARRLGPIVVQSFYPNWDYWLT